MINGTLCAVISEGKWYLVSYHHSPPPNLQFVWNLVKLLVDIKCNTGKNRDKCNQSVLAKGIIMLTDDTSIMTKKQLQEEEDDDYDV